MSDMHLMDTLTSNDFELRKKALTGLSVVLVRRRNEATAQQMVSPHLLLVISRGEGTGGLDVHDYDISDSMSDDASKDQLNIEVQRLIKRHDAELAVLVTEAWAWGGSMDDPADRAEMDRIMAGKQRVSESVRRVTVLSMLIQDKNGHNDMFTFKALQEPGEVATAIFEEEPYQTSMESSEDPGKIQSRWDFFAPSLEEMMSA